MFVFDSYSTKEVYSIINQVVIPRPIAWIHSNSENNIGNLAPFSYFNAICSNPPIVMVSITGHEKKGVKDTLSNIQKTKEFTINIPSVELLNQVVDSAADYPTEVDESEVLNVALEDGTFVRSKKVIKAPVNIECKLEKTVNFGDPYTSGVTVVFGRILALFIDEKIFEEDLRVDPLKLNPLCRLGRAYYAGLGQIFTRKIPEL